MSAAGDIGLYEKLGMGLYGKKLLLKKKQV
jgi:hypothetical protein